MTAVFLDFGGVLSPPIEELFEDYERKTGIAPLELKWAMQQVADDLGVPMLAPVELAMITEAEWVDRMHAALLARDPSIDLSRSESAFGRQWFAGHRVNSHMSQLVSDLKARGYQVGILTNNVVEWEPYWRAMVGLDDVVDHIVDSCRVGARKPDPRIFELARQMTGLPSHECYLVDDLAENCAAAVAAGWQTVRFVDTAQAVTELEELLGRIVVAPTIRGA
ncbi:HAD family hydrolase [Nocardia australiensis]|uniref:HAD family hydrolase n=1 Tax=Nocardia australiensis TaxID=2887191 RepID=UPI001D14BA27|nr:HAD family phosphatase [Nocardia australiensis]